MRRLGTDKTHYGYFRIYDNKGTIVFSKIHHHCSQELHSYTASTYIKDHQKIVFYFPNDYLISFAKSKEFLEYFCELTSEMFDKVSYLGEFTAKDLNFNVSDINSKMGYINTPEGKPTKQAYIANRGDLIISDSWSAFEVDISKYVKVHSWMPYASYCLIRYLFASHYHEVAHSFNYLVRNKLMIGIPKVDNFELLQLAHYWHIEKPSGANGFFNSFSKNEDDFAYNLVELNEFKKKIEKSPMPSLGAYFPFNCCFGEKLSNKIKVKDIQNCFKDISSFKNIYEKLK